MRYSSVSLLSALTAPFLVSAAPLHTTRQADNSANILVLKFAGVLEQLETQFYQQAIAKYKESDFVSAGFSNAQVPIEQLANIAFDEATHTTVIQGTLQSLGSDLISGCNFDFSTALTDVATTATVARLVENVGVGAYLGAAHLVTDPVILTAAASILTTEARHQTVLNLLQAKGTAIPSAFDIPLTPSEVLAIAGGFISGCSTGLTANPALAATNTGTIGAGTTLTFSSPALNSSVDTSKLFCQLLVGGSFASMPMPYNQCTVPSGMNGPVAVFITSDGQPLSNNVVQRATSQLVAGPMMMFIDDGSATSMNGVIHSGSSSGSSSSSSSGSSNSGSSGSSGSTSSSISTTTISGASASAIIASASSASGAAPTGSASSSSSAAASSSTSTSGNNAAGGASLVTDVLQYPNGPNMYKGPSADGSVMILGSQNVTRPGA